MVSRVCNCYQGKKGKLRDKIKRIEGRIRGYSEIIIGWWVNKISTSKWGLKNINQIMIREDFKNISEKYVKITKTVRSLYKF